MAFLPTRSRDHASTAAPKDDRLERIRALMRSLRPPVRPGQEEDGEPGEGKRLAMSGQAAGLGEMPAPPPPPAEEEGALDDGEEVLDPAEERRKRRKRRKRPEDMAPEDENGSDEPVFVNASY